MLKSQNASTRNGELSRNPFSILIVKDISLLKKAFSLCSLAEIKKLIRILYCIGFLEPSQRAERRKLRYV